MKQTLLIVIAVIFIIICLICTMLINIQSANKELIDYNKNYENYLNREILGTDLATLISKVIDQNEKNNVKKDENGYYIDNEENSVRIDLKMTTINKIYPMEEIHSNDIARFVQNFNFIKFKCTSIEYHKQTKKISKMTFEELE